LFVVEFKSPQFPTGYLNNLRIRFRTYTLIVVKE
jgi:hypothetical protein